MNTERPQDSEGMHERFDRRLIRMAGSDIADMVVDKLGIYSREEISGIEDRTTFMYVPGQVLYTSLSEARHFSGNKDKVEELAANTGLSNDRVVKVARVALVAQSLVHEVAGTPGTYSNVSREAIVRLYPPLYTGLFVSEPKLFATMLGFTEAYLLATFPVTLYHEMVHGLGDFDVYSRIGVRKTEKITDLITGKIIEYGSSPLARYTGKIQSIMGNFRGNKDMSNLYYALTMQIGESATLDAIIRYYGGREEEPGSFERLSEDVEAMF